MSILISIFFSGYHGKTTDFAKNSPAETNLIFRSSPVFPLKQVQLFLVTVKTFVDIKESYEVNSGISCFSAVLLYSQRTVTLF